ncbi:MULTISPECIES: DUF899 family protein [Kitasatospora]|uniref:DUF899 family protein n=1 Tax=Kitasatospora aburaviensis TaxID=67265 RepID=A0ABW1EQ41_9ACTN
MEKPAIVSAEEWQLARGELLKAEKELTRAQDALAARRRRLPMRRALVGSGPRCGRPAQRTGESHAARRKSRGAMP